uniref:Inhibitor of growth protein N-terminal histone-binding domain-containing protein n=1 Tax=Gadus morhua TaxID=8049 RepID=A0A8C5FRF1_GADMO
MAAGMYLEHYLDSIENLPFELQRNFNLMRDLDQRTEDLKGQIDSLAKEYTSNARTLSSEQKLSILRQIQQSYSKCKEFGDDKVQLAMQTYEMVDKHIRRLDTDLARFEADLKEKQIESTDYDSTSSKGKKTDARQKEKKMAKTRSKVKSSDEDGSPKSAQKKVKLLQPGEFNAPASNFGNVHPSDVLDMPVDPNEPTYCLCHQVSYGEMIGCDNTDVSLMHNSWLDTRRGNSNRKYMYVYNYLNLLYIITRQLNRDLYTFFLDQEMSPFLSLIERCKGLKA